MFEPKYLIMMGVLIVCVLVLYYFYGEISGIKKSLIPTYQKTMMLESKISELDKKQEQQLLQNKKNICKKVDTPVYSISYQSDMFKPTSIKYTDICETDAKKIVQNIQQNDSKNLSKKNSKSFADNKIKIPVVPQGDISDFDNVSKDNIDNSLFSSEMIVGKKINLKKSPTQLHSDTINLRLSEILVSKNNNKLNDMGQENIKFTKNNNKLNDTSQENIKFTKNAEHNKNTDRDKNIEFKKILDGLSVDYTEFDDFDNLDHDVVRYISESIKYPVLSPEQLSETSSVNIPFNNISKKLKTQPPNNNKK